MQYTFALAGNQNSGKTTLFNQLTGSNQHVGNWPGVTVEQKTGTMLHHHHGKQTHMGLPWRVRREQQEGKPVPDQYSDVTIVDLPGIYSLSPYSMEEIVSRNFIVRDQPDVVINIVDATNLERNLYLTLQLLELGRPVVVALNMMDEVRSHGDSIDLAGLEKGLGVPVVAICARKGEGIDELVSRAMEAAVLSLFAIFYRKIFSVTFDETFARATGEKVERYNALLAFLTAITVVLGMRVMGAMLISSLIVFPGLTAMRVFKSFRKVLLCALAVSVVCFFAGLCASFALSVPTGASVVVANVAAFLLFSLIGKLRKTY